MREAWELRSIIAGFQAAAAGAASWQEAIDGLTFGTGSYGSCVLPLRGEAPALGHSASLEEVHASYHRDGWVRRDMRYLAVPHMRRNGVGCDLDFMPADEIARHPYWQEWLAPHGLRWFAGVPFGFAGMGWCLSIQRTIRQGPFNEAEKWLLARLVPHLSSAAALAFALRNARIEAALSAFEASHRPILLIDRFGGIIGVNALAERILGSDLQIRRGKLISWDRAATLDFARAVADLLWNERLTGARAAVTLPRRLSSPLTAHLTPLSAEAGAALGGCGCVVTLVDTETPATTSARLIREILGLTEAEARLALSLGTGSSVEEAALIAGVTYETARTHLRNIYGKLGINRQTQLVLRVNSVAERVGGNLLNG